jgi:hypothetical protein
MIQIVYLETEDDLPAIRHLLEGSHARQVALVIPKGNATLHSVLNLRVLHRHAADLALDVALVTRDSRTRQVAKNEGFAVLATVRRAKRGNWRSREPRLSVAERAVATRVAGLRAGRGDRGYGDRLIAWLGWMLGALLLVALFALVAGLSALLVPEARVTVVPFTESVTAKLELRADPDVEKASLSDLTIPARVVEIEVEETGEVATQSKRDAPDAPATGRITFINQAGSPLEILPGTVMRTSTGATIRFKTVTTTTLEPSVGARAEADIEALEPGPAGNVAAATITEVETTSLRGKVGVINEQPTKGGGVKQVGVVTRADMDRLKVQTLEKLEQKAYIDLQNALGEEEFIPRESMFVEILSEVYDQFLDSEADTLHLQMLGFASGTAVDEADAELLSFQALKDKIPRTYQLTSDEITFSMEDEVWMDGRAVIVHTEASAPLVAELDRGAIRRLVAGMTEAEAVESLTDRFALGAPPEVQVFPEWIKRWEWLDRVPLLPFRIQVVELRQ